MPSTPGSFRSSSLCRSLTVTARKFSSAGIWIASASSLSQQPRAHRTRRGGATYGVFPSLPRTWLLLKMYCLPFWSAISEPKVPLQQSPALPFTPEVPSLTGKACCSWFSSEVTVTVAEAVLVGVRVRYDIKYGCRSRALGQNKNRRKWNPDRWYRPVSRSPSKW